MIKIDVQYIDEDEVALGKVHRLYPRGTKRPRSHDIRIVRPCICHEPIMDVNGMIVKLEHHCKYYSDPI